MVSEFSVAALGFWYCALRFSCCDKSNMSAVKNTVPFPTTVGIMYKMNQQHFSKHLRQGQDCMSKFKIISLKENLENLPDYSFLPSVPES